MNVNFYIYGKLKLGFRYCRKDEAKLCQKFDLLTKCKPKKKKKKKLLALTAIFNKNGNLLN